MTWTWMLGVALGSLLVGGGVLHLRRGATAAEVATWRHQLRRAYLLLAGGVAVLTVAAGMLVAG